MPPDFTPLTQAVADAPNRHTRLLLVIGPIRSGKTEYLLAYHRVTNNPYLAAGSVLAERLLATPARFRDTAATTVLQELCQGTGAFLLDNLELLFSPESHVDPYRLLVGLARTRTIVAAWPGHYQNGTLTYAAAGHREYRSLTPSDTVCILL